MMDDEKTYLEWIASRKNIAPEPDLTDRVMHEIRKFGAAAPAEQSPALQVISCRIFENRFLRVALAVALSALGLFRVVYVPSMIFLP